VITCIYQLDIKATLIKDVRLSLSKPEPFRKEPLLFVNPPSTSSG